MLLANAGLPMLFVGVPIMTILLVPIVVLEAIWYRLFLPVSWARAWRASLSANIWSTFVGMPLAWVVWVAGGLLGVVGIGATGIVSLRTFVDSYLIGFLYFVGTSGWLFTADEGGIVIHASGLVLLLPAYLVSYLGEARILRARWSELNPKHVYRQVWAAHMLTYGLLYSLAVYRYCQVAFR